jgi:hypothetical protein
LSFTWFGYVNILLHKKIANQPEHNSETKLGAKMRERQIHNESTPFERHYP